MASNMSVDVMVRLKDRLTGPLGRLKKTLSSFTSLVKVGAVAAITAFTAAMTASIFEAVKFQKLWDEANKTLGMSKPALQFLKDDLDVLATKIPLARDKFVEMAEQAGNIGIRGREQLVEFIELAAKMGLTFDGVDPQQGAKFLGNWRESLGYTQVELAKTVDQINYLGNTTNAGAGPLAKFASDSLAAGDAAGYMREETLALGAAVIAAGKAPEIATTGFRAMNRFLTGGAANLTKSQKGIVSSLGLDMNAIQKQMQTDATGAIRTVSEAISKMPVEKRTSIVTQLFGDEAARVFGPLLGDIDKLEKALKRIDDLKKKSAGSADAEFLGVSDNVSANWQKVKNIISKLRDEAGQPYLEPINNGLKAAIGFLTTLDDRVTILDRIKTAASGFLQGIGLGSAVNALDQVLGRLGFIRDFIFGVVDGPDAGEELAKGFLKAQKAGKILKSVLKPIGDVSIAALSGINKHLKETTGLQIPDFANLVIDKSAAAGAVVISDALNVLSFAWERIKALGSGFMTGFMDNISDGLSGWDGLGGDVSELGAALVDLYSSLKELLTFGDSDLVAFNYIGEFFGTLAAGGVGAAGEALKLIVKALKGIVTAATELSNFLQGKPVNWDALEGAGLDILTQIGDLINAILSPLEKLLNMDLTIDWSKLGSGLTEAGNKIKNGLNSVRNWWSGGSEKVDADNTKPDAANDNSPTKVKMPVKLDTNPIKADARINNAFGDVKVNAPASNNNVQKVEFSPLQHEVTSKVDVGGGVHVTVTGPAKVTGATSTNPNAPVTANTGRAVGRL